MTRIRKIQLMDSEELAEFLCDLCVDHSCEHVCAYANECVDIHVQEFCIEQISKWLEEDADEGI